MSDADEKKARLEAIRAANRAKAEAEGRAPAEASATPATPAAPAVIEAPAAAAVPAPAAPAPGPNKSDDKAARLAAIRAANANKGGAPSATATTTHLGAPAEATPKPAAPVAAPKPAATTAAPAAKPAAKAAPARRQIPRLYKVIGGALFMILVFGLLATTTKNYLWAIIIGGIFGAVFGLMFGSWPPGPGDEVTGGE